MGNTHQNTPGDKSLASLELESIYNLAPVGLCVFDGRLRYVRINERLAEMNGVPVEQHIGRTPRDIVPDMAQQAEAIYWQVMETGKPVFDIEFSGTTVAQPGIMRTWIEHWMPLKDEKGTVIGINVVAEEITESKQPEEKIQILAKFPSESPNPVLRVGKDGMLLYANDASLACLKTWKCKIGQCLPDEWHRFILDALSSGSKTDIELDCEGQVFFLTIAPVVDGDYVNLYGLDITERKRAEEEVHYAMKMKEALNRINETVHSTLDYDEVARRVLAEGAAVLGSETAAFSLREDDGWTIKHVHGIPTSVIGTRWNDDQERHAVHAIRSGQPLGVEDAFNDDRFNQEHFRRHKIRAVLVAPLIIRGQPYGVVFYNFRTGPHKFTEAESDFLRQLAATASIALENARLFRMHGQTREALQKARDQLELRVQERTAELEKRTEELKGEIEKRRKFEADLKAQGEKILSAYQQRDSLSRRLVDLLEKERHEIGSALHDDVGQILTGVSMELEGLKGVRIDDGSALEDRVETAQALLREATMQARDISHNLRSEVLEKFGLLPSVRNLVGDIQKRFHLEIRFFTKNVPEDLKADGKDLTIYRLIQEALTNVLKHAEATEVFINLTARDGKVFLSVEDDGKGFDYGALSKDRRSFHSPLGITIMNERTSMVGGTFQIDSKPGKGTCVLAEIPIR